MMAKSNFKFNKKGLDKLTSQVINTEGVRRMQIVADACNRDAGLDDGYRVGGPELRKRDYRATVIAVTAAAQRDNAENNTMLKNMHLASG